MNQARYYDLKRLDKNRAEAYRVKIDLALSDLSSRKDLTIQQITYLANIYGNSRTHQPTN